MTAIELTRESITDYNAIIPLHKIRCAGYCDLYMVFTEEGPGIMVGLLQNFVMTELQEADTEAFIDTLQEAIIKSYTINKEYVKIHIKN